MEQLPYPAVRPRFDSENLERTPWERKNAAFPSDLFASWMECMTRPGDFFRRLDPEVPFAQPFIFFLVFWVLGTGLGAASTVAFMGDFYREFYATSGIEVSFGTWQLIWFFLSPFIGMISLGFYVLFTHLGVVLFVRSGRPMGVTARSLCYVAAPLVFNIIPFIGWAVSFFWTLYLAIVAVQQTHRTTGGRAFAAVLVPPLLVWFLFGLVFTLMFMMAVATLGTG